MTDLRKAAEMALEALDLINQDIQKHRATLPIGRQPELCKASLALRKALAQPEQEPFIYVREDNEKPFGGYEHCSEADAGAFPVYTAPPSIEAAVLAEREACAKIVEADGLARGDEGLVFIKAAGRIRARGELPPVKSYCVGKPNYCTPEDTPDVDAVNMSQERVDEKAKCEQEPWPSVQCVCGGTIYFKYTPPISDYHEGWEEGFKAAKREWVGLTDEEIDDWFFQRLKQVGAGWRLDDVIRAVEAKLKEKNT